MNIHQWAHSSAHAPLPPGAVYAGNDTDGSPIYVGRAHHEGELCVAKVMPTKQVAYIGYNGQEIPKFQFEVLIGAGFTWVTSGNGHVPPNSVQAGSTVNGQPLFVGRTSHNGALTPGKVHTSHGCLYFPYGGAEQSSLQYEVLISGMHGMPTMPTMPTMPVMPVMPVMPTVRWMGWAPSQGVPPAAVVAGHDTDGAQIYVARAYHEGEQIPGKYMPSKHAMYICWNGQEILKHQFEVFCVSNGRWMPSAHGGVPPGAVVGGHTSTGEPLYVGRTFYQGSLTPGKVHPSHGSLYIPFGGSEIPFKNYEILVE